MNAQRDSASVPVSSWCSARLFVTDEFAAPPVILRVDDSVIGTLGNFSASTGKAKSKKTFNVCAIVAAAMTGGTVLNYSASLPPERRRVLYVDTEQSRFHCKRVLCRILRLAGLPTDAHPPLLEFLCLRGYATKERLRKIEEAIYDLDDLGLGLVLQRLYQAALIVAPRAVADDNVVARAQTQHADVVGVAAADDRPAIREIRTCYEKSSHNGRLRCLISAVIMAHFARFCKPGHSMMWGYGRCRIPFFLTTAHFSASGSV